MMDVADMDARSVSGASAEGSDTALLPDLGELLRRLVREWRIARSKMGLPAASSFADIARRLNVDRGTAQRLNRIGKLVDVGPADLEQFPGVRAWHSVVVGAGQALGASDPAVVALGSACEGFAAYLAAAGGSLSAVVRHLKADGSNGSGAGGGPPAGERAVPAAGGSDAAEAIPARAAWVQAAADVMGYCIDVRVDVQLVRESAVPADGSPRELGLAMLNVLHGCRGRPGAMPLAFTRHARPPAFAGKPDEGPAVPRPFQLLRSGTSRPAPAVLTTGDGTRHTMFVEPQWATSPNPLDLALLQHDPEPIPSPWGTSIEWLEFAGVNRHPCRRLVLDRLVSREKDALVVPSLAAFRSHNNLSHDEPWFDRLPQHGSVRRLGTPAEAAGDDPFPGYSEILAEALGVLAWPSDELIVYRAVVDDPIPLASYTLLFDRRRP